MSTRLLLEGLIEETWVTLGCQTPEMPPATISNNHSAGRDVYVTQCFADHATIRRLPGGIDVEKGWLRSISPAELEHAELVKRLEIGESHEMHVKPDRAPAERVIRYRCTDAAT